MKHKSDALDLEPSVFSWDDPITIACSLKKSADTSTHRMAPSYRSAMSMLTFYINRAGSKLPEQRRRILVQANTEPRKLFGSA